MEAGFSQIQSHNMQYLEIFRAHTLGNMLLRVEWEHDHPDPMYVAHAVRSFLKIHFIEPKYLYM